MDALEATKGTSALNTYELRRRGFVCLNFEGLMWKYAFRGVNATSRTSNRKNMSNDYQIPHGIFKPTGRCEADGKSTSVGLFTMGDYKK
jgi:hypothetical protein